MPERPAVLAFLREIKDHPEDDTSRLVLADWLEEQGDPRGEFVRLQVERARLPEEEPRRKCLAARERQLLDEHAAAWVGPWQKAARRWEFQRGLLHVQPAAGNLAGVSDATLTHPATDWIDSLRLSALGPETAAELFPVNSIDLTGVLPLNLADVAAAPAFGGLRRLRLPGHLAAPGDANEFAPLADLPHLNTLELTAADSQIARAAAMLPTLPGLRTLRLIDCQLRTANLQALAASPRLAGLTTLHFVECHAVSPSAPAVLFD